VSSTPSPAATKPKKKRKKRRPRFRFDSYVPDLQFAADTSDIRAFGIKLKLIATQDVGGRDHDLLDTVIIDEHESSELIVDAAIRALSDLPGAQFLTDQGTPYMAEKTREALEALKVEHAPQKEGDPPGKATIERAFETVKSIAAPILALTSRIATAVPALRDAAVAKASTQLLVTALLRAYQAGSRAARRALQAREGVPLEEIEKIAARAREQARADDRSARLLLAHVHKLYEIPRAEKTFVDSLRRYPVDVLKDAERRFRSQVHRDDIRDRASYFAKIVRDSYDTFKKQRERERRSYDLRAQLKHDIDRVRETDAANDADPVAWLKKGLELVAVQWDKAKGIILAGGAGLGAVHLRGAIASLVAIHGPVTTTDIATTALRDFSSAHEHELGPAGITAIQRFLERLLPRDPTYDNNPHFAPSPGLDILVRAGKTGHRQPFDPLPT